MSTEALLLHAAKMDLLSPEQVREVESSHDAAKKDSRSFVLPAFLVAKGYLSRPQLLRVQEAIRAADMADQGFELQEMLGTGSYGTVYKGRQVSLGREVAIKMMAPGTSRDPKQIERFSNEIRFLAKLNHENLVNAISAGRSGDHYYLVMEYVDGPTLRRMMRNRGPMPVEDSLNFVLQLTRALDYAHDQNLIHRDIKPENVLITSTDVVKLCDLGLAKSAGEDAIQLTMPGTTMGTPKYLSPEQAQGSSDLDKRVDLYALGIMFYEMLAGEAPFSGDSSMKVLVMQINDPLPNLREKRPDVPGEVVAIIEKLARKDREERYANTKQLIEDLEATIDGRRPKYVSPPPTAKRGQSTPADGATPSMFDFSKSRRAKQTGDQHRVTTGPRKKVQQQSPARRRARAAKSEFPAWLWLVIIAAIVVVFALLFLALK